MTGDDLDGCTKGPKLVSCCFLLQHYSNKPLLEVFFLTSGFSSSGSCMGSIPGCDEDPVKVVAWLGGLDWLDGGFKLADMFPVFTFFFSGGPLLSYF